MRAGESFSRQERASELRLLRYDYKQRTTPNGWREMALEPYIHSFRKQCNDSIQSVAEQSVIDVNGHADARAGLNRAME